MGGHVTSRRALLKQGAATAAGLAAMPVRGVRAGASETLVPTRAITRGPRHHWFGYYDKREFDPTNRYVLSNEVTFEGRTVAIDSPHGGNGRQVWLLDVSGVVAG